MRKFFMYGGLVCLCSVAGLAAPITVNCTVTSGTVLTSTSGGTAYSIANGIGTSSGGATGVISCPGVSAGAGNTISSYQVLATIDYQNGPIGTTSGTSVTQLLTLVGGSLNGASVNGVISGGNSSSGVVPPVPFQIGSTLSGAESYSAFTVNVTSSVSAGGPVSDSGGQVILRYDSNPVIPEPSTYMLFAGGLIGVGLLKRKRFLGR